MQQTILTLGALMIITMTSVNQQRSNFMIMESTYLREFESAAYDYANKRIESITNSYAYDESVAGDPDAEVDLATLTAAASFGKDAGEADEDSFDDLDDFHDLEEEIRHGLSADSFNSVVTYTIRYVDPSNPSAVSASASMAKEITVNVASADTIGVKVAKYSKSKITLASDTN